MCDMEKATREEMRTKALQYMEMLGIDEEIKVEFEKDGKVYVSYKADGSARAAGDEERKLAEMVEKEYGGMIYHMVFNKVFGEDMLTLLHISQSKEEWEGYLMEIGEDEFLTYAYVKSPFESMFGSVVIAPAPGAGVIRKG